MSRTISNFSCNENEKNAKIISGWFPKLVVPACAEGRQANGRQGNRQILILQN
jgi:hypothetical protein